MPKPVQAQFPLEFHNRKDPDVAFNGVARTMRELDRQQRSIEAGNDE